MKGMSALKSLKAELPYHIKGLYYTDEIGNISTSNAFRDVRYLIIDSIKTK
jgi:hypothetical protein